MKLKIAKIHCVLAISCLFTSGYAWGQETKTKDLLLQKGAGVSRDSIAVSKATVAINKGDQNRNVMLNAANNNGPREVNVGLPSSVGGTTIMENDLPVVYYFWPELPNRTWRGSVSLGKTGLLSLKDVANTTGDFGYAVNSYTKLGGDKTEVNLNLATSHFGWLKGDVNVSGALDKSRGLYYTAGVFQNYDPQSFDLGFTNFSDKTQIYRAGLTKRLESGKGEVSLLYKYARSLSLNNYALFEYQEGGETKELDNFRIGRDSYAPRTGKIRMLDAATGQYYTLDMGSMDDTGNTSHTVDLLGNYKLANNWLFKYVMRFHSADSKPTAYIPTSILQANQNSGLYYQEDGTPYTGPVQALLVSNSRTSPVASFTSRFELLKKVKAHNLKIGFTEYAYKVDRYIYNRTALYQSVEPQPRLLSNYGSTGTGFARTDEFGFFAYNQGTQYYNGSENQLTGYFSDTWTLAPKLDISYGLNLRYHRMAGNHYQGARRSGFTMEGIEETPFEHNWFNVGGNLSAVYKITNKYGVIGDIIYTENNGVLNNYANASVPSLDESQSKYGSVGVYWNEPKISIVSSFTYLTKNNFRSSFNLVNPTNSAEVTPVFLNYGIQTMGWTTDIVAKPFKGFNLHYLITVQDPIYKDYKFEAFGNTYDYEGKNVLQVSKVLMEIDPSYTFLDSKFRVWGSLRYFSDQYANLTNVLYFKGWWETFGGVNYKVSKTTNLGLTVVNFLNQRGAKGTINGSELVTDATPYYGTLMTSQYIRPFTVEASASFKF